MRKEATYTLFETLSPILNAIFALRGMPKDSNF